MTKEINWPVRAIYIVIALAMALGLLLTPALTRVSVSASPDESEWELVSTPTAEGFKIAPNSQIVHYGAGAGGKDLHVIGFFPNVDDVDDAERCDVIPQIMRSNDYGASWKSITDKVVDEMDDQDMDADGDGNVDVWDIEAFLKVAQDPVNWKFMVVAFVLKGTGPDVDLRGKLCLFVTDDGGATFHDMGAVEDGTSKMHEGYSGGYYPAKDDFMYLTISTEVDGEHNIALSGIGDKDLNGDGDVADAGENEVGLVFRYVTGLGPGWQDTTIYDGWDDDGAFKSAAVPAIRFAASFPADGTVVATTVTSYPDPCSYYGRGVGGTSLGDIYVQSGVWGKKEAWNEEASFKPAVLVVDNQFIPALGTAVAQCSFPTDYKGRTVSARLFWVICDFIWDKDEDGVADATDVPRGVIFRVDDDRVTEVIQQIEDEPWVATVSYWGYMESGKAIGGLLGDGFPTRINYGCGYTWKPDATVCEDGVQVYRNDAIEDMDICCKNWKPSCKPPSGTGNAACFFPSDQLAYCPTVDYFRYPNSYRADESAWSVSFDSGETWNQVSLIDTHISYISDVAKSPDCNKTMLATANNQTCCDTEGYGSCYCDLDSVWLYAETLSEQTVYSKVWLRTWYGDLVGDWGLLRLAPEETTGDTVYLVDEDTDTVYWNDMETLACWEEGHSTVDEIVDLAVKDEATIFALGYDGSVAWSDDHGATASWEDPVETGLEDGLTIAVLGDNVLVGGQDSDVSLSTDAGVTYTELEDIGTESGYVKVAFDTFFDENNIIYAATAWGDQGIYRWTVGESDEWKDLKAADHDYFGIVLGFKGGNPMSSAATGGVLYASYVDSDEHGSTGVARCLRPAEDVCCGAEEWDYLHAVGDCRDYFCDDAEFRGWPSGLKICGCLDANSNTRLFAIDDWETTYYDSDCAGALCESCGVLYYDDPDCECEGRLWTYEDCFSKGAPTLVSPADGSMIPADDCYCYPAQLYLKWERMCNACSYDIEIAKDADFNEIVWSWMEYDPWEDQGVNAETPGLLIERGDGALQCNHTYYWRVRVHDAETTDCDDDHEVIHSWWAEEAPGDVWSFSVAVGPSAALKLTAPDDGGSNLPVTGIAFTWTEISGGAKYDFALSANADLSSPVVTATGLTTTAYTFAGTLDKNKAYYWRVTAKKDGVVVSQSPISTFSTAPEKPAPPPPAPAPKTPLWVWVVIGIGAVLVIVVIVLIFRTRRV